MERLGEFPQMYQFILSGQYKLVGCSSSIETKFALQGGSVSAANPRVDCSNTLAGVDLSICVPTLSASDPQDCTENATTVNPITCGSLGSLYGVSAAWIKAWNPLVDCANIPAETMICIAH